MKMPSVKKGLRIKPKRPFGLHAAFGSGPKQAFGPQSDQASAGAMAFPQAAGGVPAVPEPSPIPPAAE